MCRVIITVLVLYQILYIDRTFDQCLITFTKIIYTKRYFVQTKVSHLFLGPFFTTFHCESSKNKIHPPNPRTPPHYQTTVQLILSPRRNKDIIHPHLPAARDKVSEPRRVRSRPRYTSIILTGRACSAWIIYCPATTATAATLVHHKSTSTSSPSPAVKSYTYTHAFI